MARFTKVLEVLANIGILIVVVVLIVLFIRNREVLFSKPNRQQGAVGKTLTAPAGMSWGNQDSTLLVVLREGCRYCEASLPFYRNLAALAGQPVRHLSIVMPDQASAEDAYLMRSGLNFVPHVAGVSLASVNIIGTPTILLVDAKGKVQKEWIGQLSQIQEREVEASLKTH